MYKYMKNEKVELAIISKLLLFLSDKNKKYLFDNNLISISHLKNSKEAKKYGFIYSYYIYLSYIEL